MAREPNKMACEPNKMACAPNKDSDQSGHAPSLIRVFGVRMKKACCLATLLVHNEDSDQTGGCPGWSESSLGAHVSLLILSRGVSCNFRLGLDYVDLYLIHSPYGGDNVATYKQMMEFQKQGLIR